MKGGGRGNYLNNQMVQLVHHNCGTRSLDQMRVRYLSRRAIGVTTANFFGLEDECS